MISKGSRYYLTQEEIDNRIRRDVKFFSKEEFERNNDGRRGGWHIDRLDGVKRYFSERFKKE